MTHLDDDYKDAPFSSDFSQPPEVSGETPFSAEGNGMDTAETPAITENVAPQDTPLPQAMQTSTGNGTCGSADDSRAVGQACGNISDAVRSSFEEVTRGMSQINAKLMEFGRLTAQNNLALVQNIAGIRSVSGAVELQTAYLRGQYDTAANQLQQLQALTTDIAERASAPIKHQLAQATQVVRDS